MATLNKRRSKKTGRILYSVQVVLGPGRRPTVPLGSVTKAQAQQAKGYIESLAACRRANVAMDGRTADWLANVDADFFTRLSAVGLVEPREPVEPAPEPEPAPELPKLGEFLDSYISKRSDVKGSTATVYGHTRRCLVEYFGPDKPLAHITPADADDWRRWLSMPKNEDSPADGGQGLADNTARRRCGIAKQFFRTAIRRRLLVENSFADMRGVGVLANKSRDYFITRTDAQAVLNACPDSEWRLLFALSRYGGLRCPSEHLRLIVGRRGLGTREDRCEKPQD